MIYQKMLPKEYKDYLNSLRVNVDFTSLEVMKKMVFLVYPK